MEALDTLVFYMAEINSDMKYTDMQVFVMFDFASELYTIHGSRQSMRKKKKNTPTHNPFYFSAKHSEDVVSFLSNIVDQDNKFTYALYSFNGLPTNINDMDFEMLYNRIDSKCELSAFDNCSFDECRIKTNVKLTSRIFTLYEFDEEIECESYFEEDESDNWQQDDGL